MRATRVDMPETAWTAWPQAMVPRLVSTPVTRPFSMRMPVTSLRWWISTPISAARAA